MIIKSLCMEWLMFSYCRTSWCRRSDWSRNSSQTLLSLSCSESGDDWRIFSDLTRRRRRRMWWGWEGAEICFWSSWRPPVWTARTRGLAHCIWTSSTVQFSADWTYLAGFLYWVRDIFQLSGETAGGAGDGRRYTKALSGGGGRGGRSIIFLSSLGVVAVCIWYFSHTSCSGRHLERNCWPQLCLVRPCDLVVCFSAGTFPVSGGPGSDGETLSSRRSPLSPLQNTWVAPSSGELSNLIWLIKTLSDL